MVVRAFDPSAHRKVDLCAVSPRTVWFVGILGQSELHNETLPHTNSEQRNSLKGFLPLSG